MKNKFIERNEQIYNDELTVAKNMLTCESS